MKVFGFFVSRRVKDSSEAKRKSLTRTEKFDRVREEFCWIWLRPVGVPYNTMLRSARRRLKTMLVRERLGYVFSAYRLPERVEILSRVSSFFQSSSKKLTIFAVVVQ